MQPVLIEINPGRATLNQPLCEAAGVDMTWAWYCTATDRPLEPGTLRLAHNLTYRHADAEWIATLHKGWSWNAYRKDRLIERLIATATVAQRTVLGFPRPGSAYWDAATLAAVTARYEPLGFDPRPYAEALKPQGG